MSQQEEIHSVAIAFEQWRNNRVSSHARIPESLRQQAVGLLPFYPIRKITTTLKLSHSQLKRWTGALSSDNEAASFVRLPSIEKEVHSNQLNLELRFNNGTLLKLAGELSSTLLSSLVQTLIVSEGASS